MKPIYSLTIFIALLTSCSSSYSLVNSESYDNPYASTIHTYRIVSLEEGDLPDILTVSDYDDMCSAIRHNMADYGFVEDENAFIMVNIGVTAHREIASSPKDNLIYVSAPGPYYEGVYPMFIYPRKSYYNYYDCPLCDDIYKEGVLTIDFVDMPQHKLLYTASVSTVLDYDSKQIVDSLEMNKAMATLFSKFPQP